MSALEVIFVPITYTLPFKTALSKDSFEELGIGAFATQKSPVEALAEKMVNSVAVNNTAIESKQATVRFFKFSQSKWASLPIYNFLNFAVMINLLKSC